jgi:hypothetical protein
MLSAEEIMTICQNLAIDVESAGNAIFSGDATAQDVVELLEEALDAITNDKVEDRSE